VTDSTQRLLALGRADLASRFDPTLDLVRDPFLADRHQPHASLWYAGVLLDSGDTAVAERIVERVLTMQELREGDPHHGNFRWHFEDEAVADLNACQFVLEALLRLPLDRLDGSLRERVYHSMRLALAEAELLDVHWTYTNIHLLDIHNRILAGEHLGDDAVALAGADRLREWARRTREVGAPHEFNSPTYAAVDINCLADLANRAADPEVRNLALEMEELLWRHVASHWHAPTMQLAGPHSRAYRRDVVGASGFLKVILYKLLGDERLLAPSPYYDGPDAEGHLIVAGINYHCPPDPEAAFREPATRSVRETVSLTPRLDTTTHITPEFALGTMSRPYGVGEPPEPWPMDNACIAYWRREGDAPGLLYTRYRVNAGPVGQPSRENVPRWFDIWEDGVFRTAQSGPRAIVAYGLAPRGQRPISSLRLDIRLLGPEAIDFTPGAPIVVTDGDVYLGIVPLQPDNLGHSPPITTWRDGDETVVSITNYEGPAKAFWEYRSLAGPFWEGNVRNGFALWIAPRGEFATAVDFRSALAATPLSDETSGSARTIRFGDVTLEYDLRDMWP
jgi:hypothetical protein